MNTQSAPLATPHILSASPERLEVFEQFVDEWLKEFPVVGGTANGGDLSSKALAELEKSMRYSVAAGGKRTRPVVGMMVAEQLGVRPHKVLPWVCAVEAIHSYSLIHDDLPCMDNDDMRRGKPTNHKVFGEACALLAGDVLLTEAFGLITRSYSEDPALAVRAITILSEGSGFRGMGGGQAIDLLSKRENFTTEEILNLHAMKTGALFRLVCEGVAVLCGTPEKTQIGFREYGAALGLCFQLADDILDSAEKIEPGSLPAQIGLSKTKEILDLQSERAILTLRTLGIQAGPLVELIKWNQNRKN